MTQAAPPATGGAGLRAWLTAALVLCGAGWGLGVPLGKIAVSEGHGQFGLIFWQMTISGALLFGLAFLRGRPLRIGLPQLVLCTAVALTGSVVPNAASYAAARHLPGGVLALVISLVPMFAFPIALMLRIDRLSVSRLGGLALGAAAVALLTAPGASLPDPAAAAFLPLALLAPLFYAIEGNLVARFGLAGLDPIQLLCGASLLGALIALPLALATGQFIDPRPPWGAPDIALILSSFVHAAAYAGYVWLVSRAGAVFAAQVAYLVTGFGILWSMTLLGERYAASLWLAFGLLFAGLLLVQPRPSADRPQASAP